MYYFAIYRVSIYISIVPVKVEGAYNSVYNLEGKNSNSKRAKFYLRPTYILTMYSVMQSDGNSLKFDTFREAITSELMV